MIDGAHLYTVWVAGPEEQPGQSRIVEKGVGRHFHDKKMD